MVVPPLYFYLIPGVGVREVQFLSLRQPIGRRWQLPRHESPGNESEESAECHAFRILPRSTPSPQVALHDYRYLGEGFRERERIKRKKTRWVKRLDRMPMLEKRALLSAIEAIA